jgi:hypothetical protein
VITVWSYVSKYKGLLTGKHFLESAITSKQFKYFSTSYVEKKPEHRTGPFANAVL